MFQRFEIHSRIVQRSGITFYGALDKLLGREVWLWRLFEFGGMERPADVQLNAGKAPLRVLRHPCIVTLHDIEADPDGVVAMLEPAVGEPLDEWMARGLVDVKDFAQIAEACLDAVSAAAAAGVPHGALEPGLIFISRSDDGKMSASLIGFGIARLVMQLQGGEHETSEALDVWMLGGILYALLTGEQIEEGKVIPGPPHEIRSEIPAPVSEWVMRLLVDDANVRPQTATDALAQLRHALAPVPVEQVPAHYYPPMQPAQPPAGYDPNLHAPVWQYPQVPVWHVPPPQWTQPYDPALAAQQPQMWQQMPWYPWPGQMPHDPYQQQLAAQQPAPPVAAVNPNAPKPRLPVPQKSAASADAKSATTPVKSKVSLKKWIGPAISLAAAAVVIWFFRDVFAPVFRRETWQGMLGDNVTIKWPGGSPPPTAPVPVVAVAPAPVRPVAPARAPAKRAAPNPPPTGPVFSRKFSSLTQNGGPAFTAVGGKFTREATPATWSGGQIAGRLTAEKPFAMLTAPLPKDARLTLKKGMGVELKFDAHIDGSPSASPRGFRFGLFASKKGGYFAVVPVGGPGELAIMASKSSGKNSASDTDSQEFRSTGNRSTPGLASGKIVHCTLTIRISADDKLQIDAKADDAAATVIIDPKTDPRTDNFTGGLLILRNGDNLGGFFFDNVIIEALPQKP